MQPSFALRPMLPEDADAVRALDAKAFAPFFQRLGSDSVPSRTRENILASLAMDPQGCFVAEEGGTGRALGAGCSRRPRST